MLQVVATGAYYPPVTTKSNISLDCLDPSIIKANIFENTWQKWPFKIGLGLLFLKPLLVDSGTIVQCNEKIISWQWEYLQHLEYLQIWDEKWKCLHCRKAQWYCTRAALFHLQGWPWNDGSAKVSAIKSQTWQSSKASSDVNVQQSPITNHVQDDLGARDQRTRPVTTSLPLSCLVLIWCQMQKCSPVSFSKSSVSSISVSDVDDKNRQNVKCKYFYQLFSHDYSGWDFARMSLSYCWSS